MSENLLNLSETLSSGSEAQWREMVEKTLRGKPFEKAMQRRTHDGITVSALNTAENATVGAQPTRQAGDWSIVSPNWGSDPAKVNADILEDLERGASAIAITLDGHLSPDSLAAALEGVYLEMVPFILLQGTDFEAGTDAMMDVLRSRPHNKAELRGTLGLDPIGSLARSGHSTSSAEEMIEKAARYAADCASEFPGIAAFVADGTVYANAGAPPSVELAAALSAAVHYMRAMEAAGLSLEDSVRNIQFTLSADADLWLTLSKFRALRRLWGGVLSACGIKSAPAHINAVSAVYMSSQRDPWVNILRGTAACFAAGVGGANTVTTLPHDLMLGSANAFSRRIARNIQITLLEESNLAKVADPAAGSYALETLTGDLTSTAEREFQSLEAEGGVLAYLRAGTLQADIEASASAREKDIRTRKKPVTGVSEFPNIDEKPIPARLAHQAAAGRDNSTEVIASLPLRPIAAAYENLRARSDVLSDALGSQPTVFLANIGSPADYTARSTFAKNLFEAGGIRATAGSDSSDPAHIAQEFASSGAKLAVICSTDALYAEHAESLVANLKQARCERIYIAGKLADTAALQKAGLDEMIFMGCDVVETLERALNVYETAEGDA